MITVQSHAGRAVAAATSAGEDVLLTDDHGAVSGIAFASEVRRLAWTLADLGYGPGQTVGIAAGVTIRALALRYAAGLVGCTTVYCPESPERFGGFVSMVGADLLVVRPELVGAVPAGFRRRLGGWGSPGLLDLDELAATRPSSGFADRSRPDDVAVLVSSGGTSGRPKASRRSFAAYLGLVDGPTNPDRRQLVCTPLTYVAQVLTDQALLGGGRVVLQDRFDPGAVLRIERADGSGAPVGEAGRIAVRTTGSADGYVGQDAPRGAFRADGWFAAEDLASLDRDGYLTIRGRANDERTIGGRAVMPIDLAEALYAHPLVRYAVAMPLDRDPWHHAFGVIVTLAPSRLGAAELMGWVDRHDPALAASAIAALGTVPVTPQGKPDRVAITDLLGAAEQAA